MSRAKLYGILIIACVAGYGWLFIHLSDHTADISNEANVCMIKQLTSLPCPACGSTRAVVAIIQGEFLQGFYINPFGFIILFILAILPVWIGLDYMRKQKTLFHFYFKTESLLRHRRIAIPAIILVLTNWFWNIYKGL